MSEQVWETFAQGCSSSNNEFVLYVEFVNGSHADTKRRSKRAEQKLTWLSCSDSKTGWKPQ